MVRGVSLRKIRVGDYTIEYSCRRSIRSKKIRMTVGYTGEVKVSAPKWVSDEVVTKFVAANCEWVRKNVDKMKKKRVGDARLYVYDRGQYLEYKERARKKITERVEFWSDKMGVSYARIAIKNLKSRWGSCSAKRNLNFSYKLLFLKDELVDYVVVHELAHLIELNHSDRFWRIVEKYIPNYKEVVKRLKKRV